jgi:hypothetical protein
MNGSEHELEHPKKRRRREISRRPLAARLVFDDNLQIPGALVSRGLWERLVSEDGTPAAHIRRVRGRQANVGG